MSLAITDRPIKVLDSYNVSRWNAAYEPIIFRGIRKDILVANAYNSAGYAAFTIQGNNEATAGDYIYVSVGGYAGTATVTASSANKIVTNLTYSGNATGYLNFVSARANYHIQLELYKILNNTYIKIADSIFRPLAAGDFTIDLKSMLKRNMVFNNTNDYQTLINIRDTDSSGAINFHLKEVWQGSNNAWSNFVDSEISFYVGATKQLRDINGTNMAAYVPMAQNSGLFNGKFLIHSLNPNISGWSFSLYHSSSNINSQSKLVFLGLFDDCTASITNTKSTFQRGTEYFVVMKLSNMVRTKIRVKMGGTYSSYQTANGLTTFKIIDNGVPANISLLLEIAASTAGIPHMATIDFIYVYAEENKYTAKFLLDDYEPTLFAGYPFDISFIHSDNIANIALKRNRQFIKSNGNTISSSLTPLLMATTDFAVNRMLLDESTFPAQTKYIDVSLDLNNIAQVGFVTSGYVDPKYSKPGYGSVNVKNVPGAVPSNPNINDIDF